MNKSKQLNDTNIKTNSKILWFGMQSSTPMLIVLVFFMDKVSPLEPVLPSLRNTFIVLCVISISAPFMFLGYFKRIQNKVINNLQSGMDNAPPELHRYIMFLLLGMSLCNLSALFGLILYIIAGNLKYSLFFISISFLLGFLYKPELS
jgi:hypothetical protein